MSYPMMGKRIFIVEDTLDNQIVFELLLERCGVQVEFDAGSTGTLQHLRAYGAVDLILLDLMLPGGLSGFDLYRDIRGCPEYAAVPIIAVSSREAGEILPLLQQMGFAGLIAKPIQFTAFVRQIRRVLQEDTFVYIRPLRI